MELVPLEERSDDDMAHAYVLRARSRDPVEPHEDGRVVLLRGIEYGVMRSHVLPDGGWMCRLEDLGKTEPPWREPIPGVWNLGWKPGDWKGKAVIKPDPSRGDPRDPQVVANAIFTEWMDRGSAASWNG